MSSNKDSLGDRMKQYEYVTRNYLTRKLPVIIRCDGKAFHSFTRGLNKPFDDIFVRSMQDTMKYLCENVQGCVLGYTQSDEITLLLTDYDTLTTDAWFGYGVQKMCSVAASMATIAFSRAFLENVWHYIEDTMDTNDRDVTYEAILTDKFSTAMFDARCFNIPEEEVINCFIWRQQDATRNAIQMLGQCNFSHKELHGKSCNDIQDMLMLQKGINFNDMPTEFKRGVCCVKNRVVCEPYGNRMLVNNAGEGQWVLDKNIPIFTQDRDYIGDILKYIREV